MKLLITILILILTSCKTSQWHYQERLEPEPDVCEGKAMNPNTQECLETEREIRSHGVRK